MIDLEKVLIYITCVVLTLCVVTTLILPPILGYTNKETTEITIKDKYVDVNNENGVFLVVSTDNYTYKVSDLLFKGKFNSTDIYNNLEIGKTYEIETTGYRIPFFSEYKNINKYTLKEGQNEH